MKDRLMRLSKPAGVVGTILLMIPLLIMIISSVAAAINNQELRIDYLLPAEMSGFVIAGSVLILFMAYQQRQAFWQLFVLVFIMLALLVLGQITAEVTGLATGVIGTESLWYQLVIAVFLIYDFLYLIMISMAFILFTKRGDGS